MEIRRPQLVDVSHHNGEVQFHALAAAGVVAAFVKDSQGSGWTDPAAAGYISQIRTVGLCLGLYSFLDGSPALGQFDNLAAAARPIGPANVMLDYEANPNGSQATPDILNDLVARILSATSRHPWIYGSNRLFEDEQAFSDEVVKCPLMVAHYFVNPGSVPSTPERWERFSAWQYTDHGQIDGCPGDLDLSCFNPILGDPRTYWDSRNAVWS